MMKITRDNYEIYALDYLEGQLDPAVHQEFLAFLASNEDIANELEGFTMVVLPMDEDIEYGGKDLLYKKSNKWGGLFFLHPNLNVAAAIALLLAMSIGWMMFQNNGQNQSSLSDQIATESNVLENPIDTKTSDETLIPEKESNTVDMAIKQVEQLELNQNTGINSEKNSQSNINDQPLLPSAQSAVSQQNIAVESTIDGSVKDVDQIADISLEMDEKEKKNIVAESGAMVDVLEVNTMKLLPTMIPSQEVNYYRDLTAYMVKYEDLERHKTSFEIHIPGELLSDTWTDMSFIQLKEKLLPEFLKN